MMLPLLQATVAQFQLTSLKPSLHACETLAAEDAWLDVAVLGQFKSGKSSLLNAVLGLTIFPVSALPATAVITRAAAAPELRVQVRHLDGRTTAIDPATIGRYVTETGNPRNERQVAVVDIGTPALAAWPGVRVVDTPGLGSVHAHNTAATRAWLPHAAVALVAISAERPLSEEDRQLITEARTIAGRVVVLLTKVDLLSVEDLAAMTAYLERELHEVFGHAVALLPFSVRAEPERWLEPLRAAVLRPLARDIGGERQAALRVKVDTLTRSCLDYLAIGLQTAERTDAGREQLRRAVLDESVNVALIRDELRTVAQRLHVDVRPAFTRLLLGQHAAIAARLTTALAAELPAWPGSLAVQVQRFEGWMKDRLAAELTPLAQLALSLADEQLRVAEARLRRVVEAFRDRLSRNLQAATGLTIAPAAWSAERPQVTAVPIAVGQTFMMNWELLSWLLPMPLIGGLFRRHAIGRVPWEVEKNLTRLVGDWTGAVVQAVAELAVQAGRWVETELATLSRLLDQRLPEANAFREAIQRLTEAAAIAVADPAS